MEVAAPERWRLLSKSVTNMDQHLYVVEWLANMTKKAKKSVASVNELKAFEDIFDCCEILN